MAEEFPSIRGYKIERKLGEGGMAQVYLALQEGFERHVALKVLAPHLAKDDDFKLRFVREARMAAKMSHRSIVPIYDFGICGDYHYMAMEYLPHGDLKLRMLKGIPLEEAISITKAIASGLNYAGQKGLVHRDIKPENILFREDDSPVISDFGIARQISAATNITIVGSAVGTPRYMSPEQAQGNPVDARSDLYSLGTIFYELLAGKAPFISDSAISVSIKHITEMPPPLPPELASMQPIVDLAMEKNPDNRFQTGNDFVKALAIAEDNMSTASAKTVILNSSDAILAGIASAQYSNANLTTPHTSAQQTPPPPSPPLYKRPWVWGLGFVISQALLVGAWLLFQTDQQDTGQFVAENTNTPDSPPPAKPVSQGLNQKVNDLLAKADMAMQSGRYYEPQNDSAQHYLTTLLALSPQHQEGRRKISQLYSHYLETAQQAMTDNRLTEAEKNLNQASQISYYLNDPAAKERFNALYQSLIQQRQQYIVASENTDKTKQLLKQAEDALIAGRFTSPQGDNAYELYQQVLTAFPDNQMAKEGIQRTAEALLSKADESILNHQFTVANAFVAAAEQIAPEHPGIANTRASILAENKAYDLRLAEQLAAKNEAAQIRQLLGKANSAFEQRRLTRPEKSSALYYFKQVLAITPDHSEAKSGIEKIAQYYESAFNTALNKNDVDKGESLINTYATFADANTIQRLKQQLAQRSRTIANNKARPKAQKNQSNAQISELLAGIKRLKRNTRNAKNNGSLRDRYLAILDIDPSHQQAQKGLHDTTAFEAKLAESSISEQRFSDAEKHIGIIGTTARDFDLNPLKNKLTQARKAQSQVTAYLKKASKLISYPYTQPGWLESNKEARDRLTQAYSLIDSARKISSKDARIDNALTSLDEKYATIVSTLKKDNKHAGAEEFIEDARHYNWSGFKLALVSTKGPLNNTVSDNQAAQKAMATLLRDATLLINKPYIKPGLLETNSESRAELVSAYNKLDDARKLQPENPEVHALLEKLDGKYADIVARLMRDNDQDAAQDFIEDTRRFNWQGSKLALASVAQSSPTAAGNSTKNESQVEQAASRLLDDAQSLVNHPYVLPGLLETNSDARNRLIEAYKKIDSARRLTPKSTRIAELLNQLDEKYASIVRLLISEDDEDEAQEFIDDTRLFKWKGKKLAAIK